MKKVILAALLAPSMVLAQSYPSPTFNSLVIQNPLTPANGGTGATSSTGTGSVVLSNSPAIVSPTVTGSFTATGLVTLADHATQAANTVLANVTGSTASPTAFAMPSCSGANNALRWTSGTGFTCASSIALTTSGLNQFASTTSAQLAGIVSDETGSGSLVFGTSPTIASPTITGNLSAATLSSSGVATLYGVTTPSTGQFYAGSGASISRIQDRLFVGPAALNNGTSVASQPDWLTQYQLAKGRTYGYVQTSTLAVENMSNSSSETTFVSGAQVGTQPGTQPIAITGMGVNNGTSGNGQAWAGYFEAFRDTSGTATGGAYGIEIDTMNFVGSAAVTDPYSQANDQTVGAQLASGGGFPGTLYPTTVGLNFQNNNTTFDKGIVFGSNSITGATGTSGTGIAIALGLGHTLQWYGAAGTKTSSILSTGTTAAGGIGEVFSDNQVNWLNSAGNPVFSAAGTSGAVNYVQAANNTTGNAPAIQAQGTDTNITLNLAPKGTGSVQVTSAAASGTALKVVATSNTATGASIYLGGNGATTPNKYIRSFNGTFQIVNSANSGTLMSMDDAGNATFTGSIAGSAISGTPISGSTGSFTTLSTSGTATLNSIATGGATISGGTINGTTVGATTPSTGSFTTLSASGTVTLPSGTTLATPNITGVTSGSAASAGSVGENLTGNSSGVSMTTAGSSYNCASKTLTAGDWLIWGTIDFAPAASTTFTGFYAGLSATSATLPAYSQMTNMLANFTAGQPLIISTPPVVQNVSASTTYYLVGNASFGTSTMSCSGTITAVRYH